jgi:hypothetical protein
MSSRQDDLFPAAVAQGLREYHAGDFSDILQLGRRVLTFDEAENVDDLLTLLG